MIKNFFWCFWLYILNSLHHLILQVLEIFSRELKGAVSAVASLQGHLLIASGPKITLNKWTGSELVGVAFYDAPLHVVSLNIVSFIFIIIIISAFFGC
jgi:CPSF A subunit region